MLIDATMCVLKMSRRQFWLMLGEKLDQIGFEPSHHDSNVWMKKGPHGCDYVATHVDYLIAVDKDAKAFMMELSSFFNLKRKELQTIS